MSDLTPEEIEELQRLDAEADAMAENYAHCGIAFTPEILLGEIIPRMKELHSHGVRPELYTARIANLEAKVRVYEKIVIAATMGSPPCQVCGYNGPDYFQSSVHPCAEHWHNREQILGDSHE